MPLVTVEIGWDDRFLQLSLSCVTIAAGPLAESRWGSLMDGWPHCYSSEGRGAGSC